MLRQAYNLGTQLKKFLSRVEKTQLKKLRCIQKRVFLSKSKAGVVSD